MFIAFPVLYIHTDAPPPSHCRTKKKDEHMLTVFVTFFRKFMKPSELAQNLIERLVSLYLFIYIKGKIIAE